MFPLNIKLNWLQVHLQTSMSSNGKQASTKNLSIIDLDLNVVMSWLIVFSHNYFPYKYLKYRDNHSHQPTKSHDHCELQFVRGTNSHSCENFHSCDNTRQPKLQQRSKSPPLLSEDLPGPRTIGLRWWVSRQESVQPCGSSILLLVLLTEGFHLLPLNHSSSSTDC